MAVCRSVVGHATGVQDDLRLDDLRVINLTLYHVTGRRIYVLDLRATQGKELYCLSLFDIDLGDSGINCVGIVHTVFSDVLCASIANGVPLCVIGRPDLLAVYVDGISMRKRACSRPVTEDGEGKLYRTGILCRVARAQYLPSLSKAHGLAGPVLHRCVRIEGFIPVYHSAVLIFSFEYEPPLFSAFGGVTVVVGGKDFGGVACNERLIVVGDIIPSTGVDDRAGTILCMAVCRSVVGHATGVQDIGRLGLGCQRWQGKYGYCQYKHHKCQK